MTSIRTLRDEIIELIRLEGSITVERYMGLCLGHPTLGYYTTRDPFGTQGDFTTAPEISQMFGELIGIWAAEVWLAMGSPSPIRLVEVGPGRGTLMADALRAIATAMPVMAAALDVHLVETSPVLRARQHQALAAIGGRITALPVWHDDIAQALDGPVIIIANELLDALPIQQFVFLPTGWHERLVGLNEAGELTFGLATEASRDITGTANLGDISEIPRLAQHLVRQVSEHLVAQGGAALFIDYGAFADGTTDTLQAVWRHSFVDPLTMPGEADLTVQVNFRRIATVAALANACVHGPTSQGAFLQALGLRERAEALKSAAAASQREAIDLAFERLTEMGQRGMGDLFKAMAMSHPHLRQLPGLGLSWTPDTPAHEKA